MKQLKKVKRMSDNKYLSDFPELPKQFQPKYQVNHNYNTNAPSFFAYLGKFNEYVRVLGKRIWEYDEKIQEYFDRWEHNLDTINEDVIEMMVEWLEDGTLDEILNEELLYKKPEIILSKEEPQTSFSNTYWYQDVRNSGLQTNVKRKKG